MTRKAFIADVKAASEKPITSIVDVVRGDDDGDVNFVFTPTSGAPIAVGLLALGMSFFLFGSAVSVLFQRRAINL